MAIETIMLNVLNPTGTSVFSIGNHYGALYNKHLPSWELSVDYPDPPLPYMTFNLDLSDYDLEDLGVTLVLTLCSMSQGNQSNCPLNVTVNGTSVASNWDPHNFSFYDVSWAIPPEAYGNNLAIVLELASSASSYVAIQRVTCLVFQMQLQQQSQWCWLAVATNVALFYNPNSSWSQCLLANELLNQTTCCNPGSTLCNVPGYAATALSATGNLASTISGPITASYIQEQTNAGQPVGIGIAWPGGTGHSIVASGVSQDLSMVLVTDPWEEFETSYITYSQLVNAYQASGTWTNTYLTKV